MVSPELLQYIKEVLSQGHSHEVVKSHLAKHGYTYEEIEQAFSQLEKDLNKIESIEEQAPDELRKYVEDMLRQGHSHKKIKSHLIKNGYDLATIEKVLGKPKNSVFFLLLIMFVIVATGISLYLFNNNISVYIESPKLIEQNTSFCTGVSIKMYELNNKPVSCVYPDQSMLQIMFINNGEKIIRNVEIKITGETKEIVNRTEGVHLIPNISLFTKMIKYSPEYGEIKEISITPEILEDDYIKCDEIIVSDLRTC